MARYVQTMEPPTGPRRNAPPPPPPPARKRIDGYSVVALVAGAVVLAWLAFRPVDSQPEATSPPPAPSVPTPDPAPAPSAPTPAPSAPTPAPAPAPSPAPSESETLTIEGGGSGNSPPFELAGGDYLVSITFGADCTYYIDLEDASGNSRRQEFGSALEALTVENFIYGVSEGRYYLRVTSGPPPRCPWRLTLESQ